MFRLQHRARAPDPPGAGRGPQSGRCAISRLLALGLVVVLAAQAQTSLLLRETFSREVCVHVGGVQAPLVRQVVSREPTLFVGAAPPGPLYPQAASREASLCVSTTAVPAMVVELLVTIDPSGATAELNWSGYNELLQRDVVRYDIYVSDLPFTSVSGMTPYTSAGAGTDHLAIAGLAAWQDHCFAVVAVDVLGQYLTAVRYAASYPLTRELCSREVGMLVAAGAVSSPREVASREVSLVVTTDAVPARITVLELTPNADGSSITLDWSTYNELLQRDVVRYDVYLNAGGFTDVSGMSPYTSVPAGTARLTLSGLTPWHDRCLAVVAVDALGHFDSTVEYSAAYVLSPEAVSREVSLHVGGVDSPPGGHGVSREVSVLVPDAAVPAPVTGVGSGFTATTSITAYGAVDLAWPNYNEVAQRDVLRYRIYVGPVYFEDVIAMEPYGYAPAGLASHTVTGLTGDAIYYLAVVAEDVLGQWDPTVRAVSAQASVSALGEVRQLAVQSFADRLRFTWLPPENAATFLDRYRVYFGGDPLPVTLPRDATQYEATGLEPAHGYTCRIATVDWIDTETAGLALLAATWLANPSGLRARGYDGMARLTWDGVEPVSLLEHYAVYVGAAPFDSVEGMEPVATVHGTRIDITGLTNATEYYAAVTAVNVSAGECPEVTAVAVTPEPIPPVQYADLGVTAVAAPGQAYDGDSITVSWTVTNHGPGTTGNGEPDGDVSLWRDRVVLSRDDIVGNLDDLPLGEVGHAGSLAPAAAYPGTWTGALPAGVTGTFHVVVQTDVDDAVAEFPDTTANQGEAEGELQVDPIPTPDLVAEGLVTASQTAVLGESLGLEWVVRHLYGLPLAMTWSDRIWLSRDASLSPATDLLLDTFAAPAGTLPAGGTYVAHETVTLPLSSDWVGEAFLIVAVDADARVAESDEENNLAASLPLTLSLPLLPDLAVASITAAETVLSDAWFEVHYRVENCGLASAESPTGWEERILLSADAVPGNDILLGTYTVPGPLPAPPAANSLERTVTVRAPLAAGPYWLIVQTDVAGTVSELSELNNTLVAPAALHIESAYTATVCAGIDVGGLGTPVPLSGHAWLFGSGQPATHVLVNLHVSVRGFTRVISALTDDSGAFATTWRPLPNEGGHYTVGACHPGQSSAPVQDEFDLVGLALDVLAAPPVVVVGDAPAAAPLTLRNCGDAPLTGVTVTVLATPPNLTATVTPDAVGDLAGQAARALTLWLSASSALPAEGTVALELASTETGPTIVEVPVAVVLPTPDLVVTPAEITASMTPGLVRTVHLEVGNLGAVAATSVRITLPPAPWLSLSTPDVFGPLEPGSVMPVDLVLQPTDELPYGPYSGQILITPENGPERRVPFTFRNVSDTTGSLTVYVADEYTYFTPEAPRLAGATITLKDAYSSAPVATAVTNAEGAAAFAALPQDYYQLEASAPGHASYHGLVFVSADEPNEETVFLSLQTVRYAWSVVPTEVEDVTEIVIEALFETNVPAPVVTIEPTVLNLAGLDEVGQSRQVDLTIRNHGWIAAEAARFEINTDPYFTIVPLLTELGSLPPRSTLVMPVTMTRVAQAPAGAKDGAGCTVTVQVTYTYQCGPHCVPGSAPLQVINPAGGCPTVLGFPVGPGGFSGFPAGIVIRPTPATTSTSTCNPCWPRRVSALSRCSTRPIPPTGCARALSGCIADAVAAGGTVTPMDLVTCLHAGFACTLSAGHTALFVFDAVRCLCGVAHACDGLPGHPAVPDPFCGLVGLWSKPAAAAAGSGMEKQSEYDAALATLEARTRRAVTELAWLVEVFGDERWLNPDSGTELEDFLARFAAATDTTSEDGERISLTERSSLRSGLLPAGVDPDMVNQFLARWERSLDYWQAGILDSTAVPAGGSQDFIALDRLLARLELHEQALAETVAEGFGTIGESLEAARADLMHALTTEVQGAGVCAQVRVQINQRAVQTRDAFTATLELENQTAAPIQEIAIQLQVFDAAVAPVAGYFAVGDPVLDGIGAVDGTGEVGPLATGTAVWTLIPTTDAAPDGPAEFYVGGTLRYRDGTALVEVTLTPAPITVYPQPELDLVYFHQRDVLGDDPWTEDATEPSVPYELAVMVRNRGAGSARNLRLESAQPKVIDNEKGLLIDFRIVATEVAGEALLPTLTADFGEVAPNGIKIGRWWLTSSMQGQFLEYSATFHHLDTWADDRLSIIKSVEIRELIHTVRADGEFEDGKPDFLVNAVNDTLDLPDALYLSDGSVLGVGLASGAADDGPVSSGHLTISLTAAMGAGWTYLRTADPGGTAYRLVRVERHNPDGSVTELPAENAWQTDRTFIGLGLRPRLENRLHLLDYGGTGNYTLYYQSRDQTGPTTAAFESPGESPLAAPVETLTITFAESIDPATFTWEDLTLTCGSGPNLITTAVSVVQLSGTEFRVTGLTPLTTAGGEYRLTVMLPGITDLAGNPGFGVASLEWSTLGDEPMVVALSGLGAVLRNTPVAWLDVVFSEELTAGSFALNDVALRRDGVVVSLAGTAEITECGGGVFRLGGLSGCTSTAGAYELVVDAAGVQDTAGHAGLGQRSVSWTVDTTPPAVVSLTPGPSAGASREPVSLVDVLFSEALDAASFTPAALTLSRSGGANLIGVTVTIAPLTDTTFRISGLDTTTEGDYVLSLDLGPLLDRAGNAGSGTAQATWELDLTPPAPATDLRVLPDTGLLATDGVTSAIHLTVQGNVTEPALTVNLYDLTASQTLGAALSGDGAFSLPVDLAYAGQHRLRARLTDPAGNSADSVLTVFVDQTPPEVTGLADDVVPQRSKTWTWGAADADTEVRFRYGLDTSPAGTPPGDFGTPTTATQAGGDGTWYLHVQAVDRAGNESAVRTVCAILDNTAPTVTGLADDPGPVSMKSWMWSGTDADSVLLYRHLIDQSPAGAPVGDYSLTTAATKAAADGTWCLHVQARDRAGNESSVRTVAVLLDSTAPTVTGLEDDDVPTRSKTWTWNATKEGITFRHRVDLDPTGLPDGAFGEVTTATQPDGDGVYYLHVQANDDAGNESAVVTVHAVLDNTPPAAPLVTGDNPTHTATPTWTWASGGGGGNGTFRCQIDGTTGAWRDTVALSLTADAALAEGTHTLYVQERDTAGNWSAAGSFETAVDAVCRVAYLAEGHGALTGTLDQVVPYGGSTTAVTAVPEPGYAFWSWSDGGTRSPRTDGNVILDGEFTARFLEVVLPAGEFLATVDGAGVAEGKGWWDLTGAYSTTVAAMPLDLHLVHDSRGRLTGTATYGITKAGGVPLLVRGSVRDSGESLVAVIVLRGREAAGDVRVALAMAVRLAPGTRELVGPATGSISGTGGREAVGEEVRLVLPTGMDGTWSLRFSLNRSAARLTGAAVLTLANHVQHDFDLRGRAAGGQAVLALSGSRTAPATRSIEIETTVTPMDGDRCRLERFAGTGYGQSLIW